MLKRKNFLVLLILGAVFLWGITRLFQLRYEAGDVYPPYSSHRSDPLGTKALLESIDFLPRISATRNYRPLTQLADAEGRTILFFGIEPGELLQADRSEVETVERLLRDGGRLVFCLNAKKSLHFANPPGPRSTNTSGTTTNFTTTPPATPPMLPPLKNLADGLDLLSLTQRWDFTLRFAAMPPGESERLEQGALRVAQIRDLPHQMEWPGGYYFTSLGPEWRTLYRTTNGAVVIERVFGKGSLVLAADSYHASNECIRKSRQPAYLAWLCGAAREVIFDEVHFGLMEQPGVANLIRKYRLRPLLLGLIALGLLFIWKNASSLVPRREGSRSEGPVAVGGRDSFHGFANILRRGIPEKELIQNCFAEWQKGALQDRAMRARVPEMVLVVEGEANKKILERDPVGAYGRLREIVSERKQHARG